MVGHFTRRDAVALLAGAAIVPATIPAAAQPTEKLKVAIGASGLYFLVHFVAEGAGFFKSEGLELDTIDVTTGPRQVAAVMGSSVDIAPLGLQLVIQAQSRGGDMVAICAGYDIMPMSLVLSNEAVAKVGIKPGMSTDEKIKLIKGLRIGITGPGSGTDDMIRTLVSVRGLDPDKDIKILPLGNGDSMIAAMQKGLTDGFVITSPFPETAVARKLATIVAEPLMGEVPEAQGVPYIVMGTSRATLAAKRPQLVKAVRAWTKSMKFMQENKDEARKVARHYFKSMEEPVFNAAFDKYLRGVATQPLIPPENVERVNKWLTLAKKTKIEAKYEDVVYPDIAREVGKEILGK
jgi:NitT/TauT family transport system substrate-binding protein